MEFSAFMRSPPLCHLCIFSGYDSIFTGRRSPYSESVFTNLPFMVMLIFACFDYKRSLISKFRIKVFIRESFFPFLNVPITIKSGNLAHLPPLFFMPFQILTKLFFQINKKVISQLPSKRREVCFNHPNSSCIKNCIPYQNPKHQLFRTR